MNDIQDLVVLLLGVLVAFPGAYFALRDRLINEIQGRLDKISGGKISTIEGLVAETLKERRLREETPIRVYGPEDLWRMVREGQFAAATLVETDEEDEAPAAKVAVVDGATVPKETIASLTERYVLIYKEGEPYRGEKPPGAFVTFANSSITLDARLMEALRHMGNRT